jgi:hypothetical protein
VWLPSQALTLSVPGRSGAWLARRLRQGEPPVLGRTRKLAVHLDLRTLLASQPEPSALIAELSSALARLTTPARRESSTPT